MDETEYLLSSEKNKARLEESIKQKNISLNETLTDANYVIGLLQNMDKYELDGIREECNYLINKILNRHPD